MSDPVNVVIEVKPLLSGSGKAMLQYRLGIEKGINSTIISITKKQYEQLKKGFFDKLKDA